MNATLFDDGIVRVYAIVGENQGGVRVETLATVCEAWYGEVGVGITEWSARDADQRKPEGRIRMWRDKRVKSGHLLVFPDGRQCLAGRVNHDNMGAYDRSTRMNTGQEVTDITLETCPKAYTIPEG